jgi:glyoxylase-like metal-dependent hydrolase (beta-lactamase superfamily II)
MLSDPPALGSVGVSEWAEVADRIFQRRYQPMDISISVVVGANAVLVVDTRASHRQAREIVEDLRELGPAPVRWVVDTHAHFDHSFGNAVFADIGAELIGHVLVPAHLDAYERPDLARRIAEDDDPDWADVVITPPHRLAEDGTRLDVGGRDVVLRHLGRGHTDNDLFLHVLDAGCWMAGDEIEESGPPMYGSGSFPLDWPGTVAAFAAELEPGAVIVPGHGAPVDAAFVTAQQADLATVASLLRELHAAGVTASDAVAEGAGRWPIPDSFAAAAVRDGYKQL